MFFFGVEQYSKFCWFIQYRYVHSMLICNVQAHLHMTYLKYNSVSGSRPQPQEVSTHLRKWWPPSQERNTRPRHWTAAWPSGQGLEHDCPANECPAIPLSSELRTAKFRIRAFSFPNKHPQFDGFSPSHQISRRSPLESLNNPNSKATSLITSQS